LAPNSAIGYIAKADNLLFFSGKNNEALRVAAEGLAINPNSVGLHVSRSFANMNLRQYEHVKTDIQQAMRLSPRDSGMGPFHEILAFAEFGLGNFDASVEEFGKAIDAGRRQFRTYVGLAAAYATQDKTLEANAALEKARQINSNLTIKYLVSHTYNIPGFFEALSKAGVPYE
jgi:tetratricopeptide (TPR) repeat protein